MPIPFAFFTPERQRRIRAILFGMVLFVGLCVWIFHSVAEATQRPPEFVQRLRGLGVMTWLYALVLLLDMRFWHSRFARRRVATAGVPEPVLAWLTAQMLPWFGIVYYALVADVRWYVVGLVLSAVTVWGYPARAVDPALEPAARGSE